MGAHTKRLDPASPAAGNTDGGRGSTFNGPRIRADAARLALDSGAKLIVCGHSHVPFVGRDRELTVFNPGSIGPRRFLLPIVFGLLEIAAGKLRLRHIDCETGETWSP